MKATAIALFAAMLATTVLAGCLADTDGSRASASCEETHDIPEGYGYVIIYIDQPKNLRDSHLWHLYATPSIVGWKGHGTDNNSTPDYVGASVGKQLDWTVSTQVWYSEQVPAGNYSFIRIQVDDPVIGKTRDGQDVDIGVRGESLTYTMEDDRVPWHIPEGECTRMAFSAEIVRGQFGHDYEIQSVLRDPPPQ